MATIRKRNGKFQVQVRRRGYPDLSRAFHLLRDAKEWARHIETQADRRELAPDRRQLERQTLGDLVIRYRNEIVPRKKGAEIETIILSRFLRHPICRKKLSNISVEDFAQYRQERLKEITPKSLKRQLSPVQNMFEVAREEWGFLINENPIKKLRLPTGDKKRERRLREGEYEALIHAARTRRNPIIEKLIVFALETAMRRGEILALRWEQVDLERRSVTILEAKNGHSRTIPLSTRAVELLGSLELKGDRVFMLSPNALKLAWSRMLKGTSMTDLHFHDLRHEAISSLVENGLTLPEVAANSGHRDSRMLLRYAHTDFPTVLRKLDGQNA